MNFSQVASFFKFTPQDFAAFQGRWEASEEAFPTEIPEYLKEPYLRESFAKLEYREPLADELVATAKKITAIPELYHWVWHIIHRTFFDPEGGNWMPYYTIPAEILGERAKGLVNLIIALAYVKPLENTFRRLGIPVEYALKQHHWLAGTIDIYRHAHHGQPGHTLQQTAWLRFGVDGKLFRIGRFEYLLERSYPGNLPLIYRNRANGELIYFGQDKWNVDQNDRLCRKEEACRTLSFRDSEGKLIGTRVRFQGTFDREETILNAAEYEPIASPWALFASFHIPGGERMTPEAAGESFKEAHQFFQKYFHRDIPVFVTHSWILNPEWQKRLPNSNLAKFQKSIFLIPDAVGTGKDGLFFIFGTPEVQPDTIPENTMQRTMLEVLKDGIPLRSGTAVIPTCRLDCFGHPEKF